MRCALGEIATVRAEPVRVGGPLSKPSCLLVDSAYATGALNRFTVETARIKQKTVGCIVENKPSLSLLLVLVCICNLRSGSWTTGKVASC